MSLNRYYNVDQIINNNNPEYGQVFSEQDLDLLTIPNLTPYDPKLLDNNIVELHLFSANGDYLGFDGDANYVVLDDQSNTLLVNLREVFNIAGIDRGSFKIILNILKPLFGNQNNFWAYLKEISPERNELRLELIPNYPDEAYLSLQQLRTAVNELSENDLLNHVVVNFGFNKIVKIRNIKFDPDEKTFYVKLYDTLIPNVNEKDVCWVGFEIADPYIDNVILTAPTILASSNKLKGPNFNLDIDVGTSNATAYQSWNDLLDTNTSTKQRILDIFISGSGGVELSIDYTDYSNFIFYGSAEERLKNFKYKLELLEYYNQQRSILNSRSGSSGISELQTNVSIIEKRKDNLISSFSHFEKWLYYEPTGSIFTHGVTGSLTPYPKYLSASIEYVHHTTSSIAQSWYSGAIASASVYDDSNYNSLLYTIPDHIRDNPNNSQYELFVGMVAEHFDDLYSYVKSLTSIYERDEHPQRGMPNELLPAIAESFGWKVQNTKNLSDLWLYAAGRNQSGSVDEPTGSLKSQDHRNLNYQVWRRIVNNMPYLLKNKGSARSIKALMSIYGIPHTLISIKEYGGPPKERYKPSLIEDRFNYKLNFDGKAFIEIPRKKVPIPSGYWNTPERMPDTIEFRFSTNYSSSVSMSLFAFERSTNRDQATLNLELIHANSTGTGSYSGSYQWGYLNLRLIDDTATLTQASSSYLPLYDNDMWTVQLYTTESVENPIRVFARVGKASDCVDGEIVHTSSFYLDFASSNNDISWGTTLGPTPFLPMVLGGTTGSQFAGKAYNHRFSGSMQGYKEYFEVLNEETFREHILNPGAYHGNNPTSSFYTLYRYFPLGLDARREDHTVVTEVTSSHPNRNLTFFNSASFKCFTGSQATQYTSFREQQYIFTPTVGGNNIISEKVRLEDSKLRGLLSPEVRSERSRYDFAPIDTNKLAVVFSLTDQINRDIFNHTGYFELDDYIGDPQNEYNNTYPQLKDFSNQYWQKYFRRFNINEFIKLFSVYDYSFFEQIKQLIPARADYIGGVLIEPHVLERSKVALTKKPLVKTPNYKKEIQTINPALSGKVPTYTSSIENTASLQMKYAYFTSSIENTASLQMKYAYFTSSIENTASFSASYNYLTSSIQFYDPYTGSTGYTSSFIDQQRTTCKCKRVVFHYSSSDSYPNNYRRQFATYVSMSYGWYYSKSLVDAPYPQILDGSGFNKSRYEGSKLSAPDFNVDSLDTIDGGPVVSFRQSNPNKLNISEDGSQGNLKVN